MLKTRGAAITYWSDRAAALEYMDEARGTIAVISEGDYRKQINCQPNERSIGDADVETHSDIRIDRKLARHIFESALSILVSRLMGCLAIPHFLPGKLVARLHPDEAIVRETLLIWEMLVPCVYKV